MWQNIQNYPILLPYWLNHVFLQTLQTTIFSYPFKKFSIFSYSSNLLFRWCSISRISFSVKCSSTLRFPNIGYTRWCLRKNKFPNFFFFLSLFNFTVLIFSPFLFINLPCITKKMRIFLLQLFYNSRFNLLPYTIIIFWLIWWFLYSKIVRFIAEFVIVCRRPVFIIVIIIMLV